MRFNVLGNDISNNRADCGIYEAIHGRSVGVELVPYGAQFIVNAHWG